MSKVDIFKCITLPLQTEKHVAFIAFFFRIGLFPPFTRCSHVYFEKCHQ